MGTELESLEELASRRSGGPQEADQPQREIPKTLVRDQLRRILQSDTFRSSPRMSAFLIYTVDAALAGRFDELKETCVAVAVFNRAATYDPKTDPVVRSEARRLRKKLAEYAQTSSAGDRIRISLPKGGYVPSIEWAPACNQEAPVVQDDRFASGDTRRDADQQPGGSLSVEAPADKTVPHVDAALPMQVRRSWVLFSGVFFIILLALLSAGRWRTKSRAMALKPFQVRPLTTMEGLALQPSLSPDGKKTAFVWSSTSLDYHLFVTQPGGKPLQLTSGSARDLAPCWSPDGESMAFIRDTTESTALMVLRFPGGEEGKVAAIADRGVWHSLPNPLRTNSRPAWSPDGRFILMSDADESAGTVSIFAYDLQRRVRIRVTQAPVGQRDADPVVSADGRSVAFARFISNSSADILMQPIDLARDPGSAALESPTSLVADKADIRGLSWLGPRRIIFSSNRSGAYGLWSYDFDGGAESPLVAYGDNAINPSSSQDGSRVVYADAQSATNLVRIGLGTGGTVVSAAPEQMFASSKNSNSAQYSPDGSRVAFFSDRSGSWNLWVGSADGLELNQITTFEKTMAGSPRWSPNGRWIAFDARPDGHSQVFVVAAEGGALRAIGAGGQEEKQPSWSADGRWLYINSNRSGLAQLWKIPVSGTGQVKSICTCAGYDSQESRGRLYFTGSVPGILSVPTDGGSPETVAGTTGRMIGRLWQVTEEGILMIPRPDTTSGINDLLLLKWGELEPRTVAHIGFRPVDATPSLSRHGAEILLVREERKQSDLMLLSR